MAKRRKKRVNWYDRPKEEGVKEYYSISEVAGMFDLDETHLRYWEQQTKLKPRRSASSGARMYTKEDIDLVERIKYLVVDKGLTLQAVAEQLDRADIDADLEIRNRLYKLKQRIGTLTELVDKRLEQFEDEK